MFTCYHCYHSRPLSCCCFDTCRHSWKWSDEFLGQVSFQVLHTKDCSITRWCYFPGARGSVSRGLYKQGGAYVWKRLVHFSHRPFIPAARGCGAVGIALGHGGSRPSVALHGHVTYIGYCRRCSPVGGTWIQRDSRLGCRIANKIPEITLRVFKIRNTCNIGMRFSYHIHV